jgi:NAD(P)H-nitrite reductase large subunit
MAKIVIIGNSAAGFSCCDALARRTSGNEIVVISQEDRLPYRRNIMLDYLSGKVKKEDLFLCDEDFYSRYQINYLKNSNVVDVEPKRNRVTLKDNSKITYDYLIIASGQKVNIGDIPGKTKDGVFVVYNLADLEIIKQRLITALTVCIVGESRLSSALTAILLLKDKEIKIIARPKDEYYASINNVEWIEYLQLAEIIGEGSELKAIKLSNGKVIGTSLVLFAGNYVPSTGFLGGSGISFCQDYIAVDSNMRTNVGNIFACGSVCRHLDTPKNEKTWDESASEGVLAANNILNLL